MVGCVSDAEGLVGEAYARMAQAQAQSRVAAPVAARIGVDPPKAYLTTLVTRLAIDHLQSARGRHETYPGP